MSENVVLFEVVGQVAKITLNRPDALNALSTPMVNTFAAHLDRVETDLDIRVLLITGAGRAFCAGADLKESGERQTNPPKPGAPDFLDIANALFDRVRKLPKPTIIALNGLTMAGGLELAMCCDIIVAADTAEIGDAHANFGVYPGAGGAAILPRLVPLNLAMYLLYTGRRLPARRLYDVGLVAEIHPASELVEKAMALAADIGAKSPSSLRKMKVVARSSIEKTAADALIHERLMLVEHSKSADMAEGLQAFAEKRPPRFSGR